MANNKVKFYITTPIYYSNQPPHVGSAYTTIAGDVIARYHRLLGEDVFFLTGVDEHGSKVAQAAKEAGKNPQEFCNEISVKFKKTWKILNISNNGFIRTTDPQHEKAVQKVTQQLLNNGFIYKGKYEGLYCVGCERYLTKSDLVNGKCPEHQKEPELLKEECYFFKLSKFQNQLLKEIKDDKFKIEPLERKNEMLGFFKKQKLKDIAISRSKVEWGIKLPFDRTHTAYVWVDAFLNYLTGIDWKGEPKILPNFWPPNIQLMAKDILRVHATIWPGLLLALNIPLPKQLFVHGFFTVNGQKMSKSLGNVIDPVYLAEKYGVDTLRYFLLREIPFGQDGDFSETRLKERYNSDLAKGLGNLVARVITLATKLKVKSEKLKVTVQNQKVVDNTLKKYRKALDEFKFNEALISIWELISFCDKYIEKERPWEEKEDQEEVIGNLLFAISNIAEMLQPFLPETSEKIFKQLKTKKAKPLFPRI